MAVRERISHPPRVVPERITITVGVHADDGAREHEADVANDIGRAEAGHLTVAQVATIHEFGAGHVPQRSFIRAWYDESQDETRQILQSQMKLVILGKLTAEQAAARIALAFEGSMKKRIARGIPPPLSPRTIARKGSSRALINTGQLRGAIRGKVTVG